jgi:drug/metabolite transporter (DMT)-like permease
VSWGASLSAHHRAMLLMATFAALWAAIDALEGVLLQRYSLYQVLWARFAVHVTVMLAVWGWRQPRLLWATQRPAFQFARSLLMLGMGASWMLGMQAGLDSATLMCVFWLSPLLMLLLSWMIWRERISALLWIATVCAACGAFALHPPARLATVSSLIWPLAMALCFSLYVVMTRSLRTESTTSNLFYAALGVFLALTPVMPGLWVMPEPLDALVMCIIGVLGLGSLYALERMVAAAPISVSAPFAYLQIVAAAAIALIAGMESQYSARRMVVGLLLIVGAALYLWLRESRLSVPAATTARIAQ